MRPEESKRLEDKLMQAGVKHLFLQLPWATHECDRSFGGPCGQIATYAVERFLDSVMLPPAAPPPTRKAQGKRAQPPKRTLAKAAAESPDVR